MIQTKPFGIRLALQTKDAIRRAAEDEARSQASLIEKILRDWLKGRGYLPKVSKPGGRRSSQ
jgi:hypothetical protein